jgi:hypothetical protein
MSHPDGEIRLLLIAWVTSLTILSGFIPVHVRAEMIDTAIDVWQSDTACQGQRLTLLSVDGTGQNKRYCENDFMLFPLLFSLPHFA